MIQPLLQAPSDATWSRMWGGSPGLGTSKDALLKALTEATVHHVRERAGPSPTTYISTTSTGKDGGHGSPSLGRCSQSPEQKLEFFVESHTSWKEGWNEMLDSCARDFILATLWESGEYFTLLHVTHTSCLGKSIRSRSWSVWIRHRATWFIHLQPFSPS